MSKGRTPGENSRERVLRKILVDKVVTESDLLKELRGDRVLTKLEHIYQYFVSTGYPIKRRTLYRKRSHTLSTSASNKGRIDHRVVIYYVE